MSTPTTHESAVGHVTGRAVYADEQHPPQGLLSLYPVQAPHAHARILAVDVSAALTMPGVVTVLTATDVPGTNDLGPIVHDEPVMPADLVSFYGQAVAWVVAEDETRAAAAAKAVRVDYEALPAILDVHAAIAAIMIAMIFVHVYAALWVRGTVRAMVYGTVTRAWAKQHHRAWYRQVTGKS